MLRVTHEEARLEHIGHLVEVTKDGRKYYGRIMPQCMTQWKNDAPDDYLYIVLSDKTAKDHGFPEEGFSKDSISDCFIIEDAIVEWPSGHSFPIDVPLNLRGTPAPKKPVPSSTHSCPCNAPTKPVPLGIGGNCEIIQVCTQCGEEK